jgi:hypothetical protein
MARSTAASVSKLRGRPRGNCIGVWCAIVVYIDQSVLNCKWQLRVIRDTLTAHRSLPAFPEQQTSAAAVGVSQRCQQATSHVWPKMKETANLGRPRLIDASSLTVLNSEFPLFRQEYYRSMCIGTMQRIEEHPYAPTSGFIEYELIASIELWGIPCRRHYSLFL